MKKLIGILVAVIMCAALCIPCAAADGATDPLADISELLGGIDISALTEGELSALLGEFDLENVDVDALLEDVGTGLGDAALDLEEGINGALEGVEGNLEEVEEGGVEDVLSIALGGIDMSWLEGLMGDFDIDATIDEFFGGLTTSNSVDFVSVITSFFDGLGLGSMDLSTADLGSFDIATLLSGTTGEGEAAEGDVASGITDTMAGLADTLLGALGSLGIDTATIEGLLDNEIVNFFANMYIGFSGPVEEPTEETTVTTTVTTTTVTTTAPTTKAPTTTVPKTGDSSAVIVAIGAFSAAAAAAFVCTKKKRA